MKKLMTHIVLNYPNEKVADLVIDILAKNHSEFIELQIPFSDPIADGDTISNANTLSLQGGFTLINAFKKAKFYTDKYQNPKFIFVLYANTINKIGIDIFCKKSREANIFALIIPDLPFDSIEGQMVIAECQKNNLLFIPVVSPNTPIARLVKLQKVNNFPYIYATAVAGITGSNKSTIDEAFKKYISNLRNIFVDTQIMLGFGIKTGLDVKKVVNYLDVVVVGSAIVKLISDFHKNGSKLKIELGKLIQSFKKELG